MPQSQNEWSQSKLNKTVLVKWDCDLIETVSLEWTCL